MAYGLDSDQFLLKEGTLQVGTFAAYDANDPASQFSGDTIAYIKQGTININIPREYAEFLNNTPGGIVRKDLIRKQMTLDFESGQWNSDLFQLLIGTSNSTSGNNSTDWFGPDETTQSTHGFLLTTELTNGNTVYIGILSGKITTEDFAITLSGTEHATMKGMVESFESSLSGLPTDRTRNYGFWQEVSS